MSRLRRLLAGLLVLIAVQPARGAASNDAWRKCIRSIPRCFTQSQQEQLCVPSFSSGQYSTIPGQCTKFALGSKSLQTGKFASRVELLHAESIIQLCSGAQSIGPAKCWNAFPTQMRQQMLTTNLDTMPLVQVCQHAQDNRPAQCLLLWFEISKTLNKRSAEDALVVAVAICKSFHGQVASLQQCVKQTAPHLRFGTGSELSVLQLCQHVESGSNLPAIVECTTKLGRKHISFTTIAQVCAGASGAVQPHTCFLEAQQKLRWMGKDAQITLCVSAAVQAAIAPITCALEMKNTVRRLQSLNPPTAEFGEFVANLCRGATNVTTVIECVQRVPARAFTTSQVLRLCAASTMPASVSEDKYLSALHPTSCASQALQIFQRLKLHSNDLDMSASSAAVLLCEQTTSTSPSKCLADIQHDRALSTKLRLQLCQQATNDSPQLCLRALRKFVNIQRMEIYDAVLACQQTKVLAPAECVMELLKVSVSVVGRVAARLCQAAINSKPARCFMACPVFYDDELKVLLCSQAESSAPASCVNIAITRFGNQPAMKVSLCRGAISAAPAACAIEAPLAMDGADVIELCRFASSTAPAKCAQEIPTSLHVAWHQVAQVCANATSTTPGRCLAHYVYRSRSLLDDLDHEKLISECRFAVARPAALVIAKASYNCPELRPMCPMQLELNMLDQYGDTMIENYNDIDVVYIRAIVTGIHDSQQVYMRRNQPVLQGSSYAMITNGSAVFSNLLFTGAGEFVLTFRAGEHVTEEVARVLVHPDVAAEALQSRCDKLFTRFQCCATFPPHLRHDNGFNDLQMLLLPLKFQLNSISCADYWANNIGGLVFSGFSPPSHVLYTLPRPLYELLINMDIPHADMSAFTLLGLKDGETSRSAIRRAYHQRSLEWHPDKWHALAATLPPIWQLELDRVYARITQAYDQLVKATS